MRAVAPAACALTLALLLVVPGRYGGDTARFRRFYLFSCCRHNGVVTCRTAPGDAMRYRSG